MSKRPQSGRSGAGSGGDAVPQRPPVQQAEIDIDLHGMTVDRALMALERHLRQAHASRLHIVKVIHGHGTGALKDAAQRFLAGSPLVKRHYFASHGDGGYGVTIAELDYGKGKPYDRRANNAIKPKAERWK
jgi:DNA mismatch repair protein MutS2